jgi:dipeptidyl aminopeptidase/acylaminoacyl peptidase
MSWRRKAVLGLAVAFVAGMVWAVIANRSGGGDGSSAGDGPAATVPAATAPSSTTPQAPAGSPVSVPVPQPVSLAVDGRLWALRAGRDPWPLQGSRGYLPVGWSPDGSYLLAERRTGRRALAAFPIGGDTPPQQVATGLDRAAWSPDGRWIAARSGGDLVVQRVGGATRTLASAPPGTGPVAAWSADSARVAWAAAGADAAVLVAGLDGAAPRRLPLTPGPAPTALAWSPDGTRIALQRGGDVLILPVGGGPARPAPAASALSWAPDGSRLATLGPCPCDLPGATPAAVWSADGSRVLHVTEHGDTLVSTRPDGGDPITIVRVRGQAIQRPMWVPEPDAG